MSKFTWQLNQSYKCPQYLQTMSSRSQMLVSELRTLSKLENSVKHLRWSILWKKAVLTIFAKHSILDVWQGSEYVFGLLRQSVLGRNKCLCCSPHTLCYGRMWSCATHNSFASYDGKDLIHACCASKVDHQ